MGIALYTKPNGEIHAIVGRKTGPKTGEYGSDIVSIPLNSDFKHGLFVAMSDNKTFQYYRWEDLAGKLLKKN